MRRRTIAAGLATALAIGRPSVARAHQSAAAAPDASGGERACAVPNHGARDPARRWPAPLDRIVNVPGHDVSLRDALDRVAASARFRLSYSADLLPLDRRVCSGFDATTAGDALQQLLADAAVEPIVAGDDQVVLAPVRAVAQAPVPTITRPVDLLDRVVVTGNATGTSQRGLPVALDVVSGRALAQRNTGTMAAALDDAVPGIWVWEQSPSSLLARYGSIRGASSFGVSYPKIYIDGIEVANPLLVTQFNPEAADRVEVIRGPQGAALYGADAISGVVNIVSRHDGVGPDGQHLVVRSGAGVANSQWAPATLAQDHAVSLRLGSSTRSAGLGLAVNTMGDFIPGGASRSLTANGGLRLIGARTSLTGIARFYAKNAGIAESPIVPSPSDTSAADRRRASAAAPLGATFHDGALRATPGQRQATDPSPDQFAVPTDEPQSVRQYTLGTTGTLLGGDGRWTHTATAGIDGYRLSGVSTYAGPILSATDSALRAARGGADRMSMRVSSVAQVGAPEHASATITLAAEHSELRERTEADRLPASYAGTPLSAVAWRNTTGLIAQTNVALHDALFATAGLRVERNAGYTRDAEIDALPMLGASWVHDVGGATLKLRGAYGKGIRPPRTTGQTGWASLRSSAELQPEVQSGTEAGADVLFGPRFGLHVTRFDQRASGLIQSVAIANPMGRRGGMGGWDLLFEQQNVGEITNRGWELQSSAHVARLTLGTALTLTDSRVQRTLPQYTGDLRPGDRALEVPARTLSFTAAWNARHWTAATSLARAMDWINYDRVRLYADFETGHAMNSGGGAEDYVGVHLRDYWRTYDGVTRLRASFSRDLKGGLSLLLSGDNLLDQQRGEPDNVTVVPGRTLSLGLRAKF